MGIALPNVCSDGVTRMWPPPVCFSCPACSIFAALRWPLGRGESPAALGKERCGGNSLFRRRMEAMGSENRTSVSEFILVGLSGWPRTQRLLFAAILATYLATLAGNLLIMGLLPVVLELACADTRLTEAVVFGVAVLILLLPLAVILASYSLILASVLTGMLMLPSHASAWCMSTGAETIPHTASVQLHVRLLLIQRGQGPGVALGSRLLY
ncbi:Olfactory receptor 10X1 [Platysternon megacephalum]|uniref:Olfactory receptor 10X1 n=1 Tax=Platysternon megacephalum TaxID=55544 RepID=A0A4D9DW51_9SAUR|nr:Olfactory receptor 10X1 [Platysternon megacephalum]